MNAIEPKSDKTTGYHIFAEPVGQFANELQLVINTLASANEGPVFRPHVTILAQIPEPDESIVLKKASELATKLVPTTVTLGELASEESYYRALYSRMREQDVLREWHKKACSIFSLEMNPEYVAHLSFLYGNYSHERSERIKKELIIPKDASFRVDRLHVYRTEGEVGKWYKVGEFPINV